MPLFHSPSDLTRHKKVNKLIKHIYMDWNRLSLRAPVEIQSLHTRLKRVLPFVNVVVYCRCNVHAQVHDWLQART